MTLLKQNSNLIKNDKINQFGCRFMSLIGIVQIYMNKELNADQILSIYNEAIKDAEVMNSNCLCGKKEHLIGSHAFTSLQSNLNLIQIGSRVDNVNKDWQGNTIKPADTIYTILKYKNQWGNHFTVGDLNGIEIYDPWNYSISNINLKEELENTYVYKIY